MPKISFLATLPDIQSAIKIGSDGMRIQLDVPETEKPKALPVIAMTKRVLKVTIEDGEELQPKNEMKYGGRLKQ